jgi:BirA family transcriptional regulator, biotin operon repressor / biotin---[acetyl-CoA-carboxylase] ligase
MCRNDIASGVGGSVLSEEALERALAAAGVSAPVRWDEVTASTNTTAMGLAADGAPEWTLVAAGHQTAGRGRLGRAWVDDPGKALMCSVVLRPAWDPERLGLVSLAAGAAMAEAASDVSGLDVRCKWPNDLIVSGTKVGGILAESEVAEGRVRHVVVGAGVNLEAPDDVPGAGAIGDVDAERLLAGYLSSLRRLVDGPEETLALWRSVADTLGRTIRGTTVDGDAVRGVAVDLDDRGGLVVVTDDGRVTVGFGEIHHLDVKSG